MKTKAEHWAEKKREVEQAGTEFVMEDQRQAAFIDDDVDLALNNVNIPLAEVPAFIAWLQEWYGEPKAAAPAQPEASEKRRQAERLAYECAKWCRVPGTTSAQYLAFAREFGYKGSARLSEAAAWVDSFLAVAFTEEAQS